MRRRARGALGVLATIVLASCGDDDEQPVPDAAVDGATRDDAGADLVIAPAWDERAGTVSPRLLGHNTVWVRGGLGLWDEDAAAPDADAVELVRALHPGILRFPGGTRAMRYDFSKAIGPVDQREPQCDPFLGTFDSTAYGLDEFLAIAEDVGAEVTLVAPWVDGSPEQTAALVAYANAPEGANVPIGADDSGRDWGNAGDWAARRADNGHPEPWGVAFLEIGNEQYIAIPVGPEESCGRPARFRQSERWVNGAPVPTTAADHAAQVARTAALVRAIDPAIRIGASAQSAGEGEDAATVVGAVDEELGTGDPWNARLVEDAGDAFDVFVLHPYQLGDGDLQLAERLRQTVRDLRALAPDKGAIVTEFGFLLNGGSQLNAIVSADMVRVAAEEGLEACLRHLLIEDDATGLFANAAAILGPDHALAPAYHVLAAMAGALEPEAVPVDVPVADLVALATRDQAGEALGIVLADRRAESAVTPISIALPAGDWTGEATVVHADALGSTEATVETVTLAPREGLVELVLPVHAVAVLRFSRPHPT